MKKLKYYNLLEYLTAITIILNCNSIFIQHSMFKYCIDICFTLFLVLMDLYKITKFNINLIIKNRIIVFTLIFSLYICIFFAFNLQINNILLIFITLFVDPLLLVYYFVFGEQKDIDVSLLIKLENVVLFLAISSLILWPLVEIGLLKPNMNIVSSWTNTGVLKNVPGYFGLLFMSQVGRNTSIFAEAPIYSYVLCISLFIELFIRNNKNVFTWRSIILFLSVISSFSTTGLMISVPLFMYKFLISHINILKKCFFILIIPAVGWLLKYIFFNKVGSANNLNSSYNTRMNDITSSIIAWKNHPLIGNGLYNKYSIQQNMFSFRLLPGGNQGISTGFFSVLALGGILYALFYIIPTILALFTESYANKGIAIFNFILLIYTIVPTTHLCILVFSYLMACYIKDLRRNNSLIKYAIEMK